MSHDQTHSQDTQLAPGGVIKATQRVKLADLMKQMREIEIDHEGKIYRLRLTQANKLILTA